MDASTPAQPGPALIGGDFSGAVLRENDFSGARILGTVMRDVEIDGLIGHLVVNGVEVDQYVSDQQDLRYPERIDLRSDDPAIVARGHATLRDRWRGSIASVSRLTPEQLHASVDGEWSALQTLRHVVLVHDAWFGYAVLGHPRYTSFGLPSGGHADWALMGVDLDADPTLDQVLTRLREQDEELAHWLESATRQEYLAPAPIGADGYYPPAERSTRRTVADCVQVALIENWAHWIYADRDLKALTR